ncbi:hypothetical protein WN55_06487 [Dufourea novaeangliae]|uniref:Uncharacterized protein n=1 Tax=Dufourea novaeangliae TaxID=178035 RepID=A0A154PRT2_DUFNO|nr:hypothetical protein WN55_06487 [Dufourea novaeangliae]
MPTDRFSKSPHDRPRDDKSTKSFLRYPTDSSARRREGSGSIRASTILLRAKTTVNRLFSVVQAI